MFACHCPVASGNLLMAGWCSHVQTDQLLARTKGGPLLWVYVMQFVLRSGVCAVSLQAQYMPLESQEGANGEAAQPLRAASNGGVGTV